MPEGAEPQLRTEPDARGWLSGFGEMATLIRARDWSESSLGPVDSWPQSLRTTVSLCLASNFPIDIIWGPQRVQIYNDGYRPICGAKHPHSLGQDFKECWLSAWSEIGEAYERAAVGETSFIENRRIFIDRNGYLEETFFTFSLSPIRDENGGVGGVFHPVTELTQQALAERRLQVLRDLADRATDARTITEVCSLISGSLAEHELDVPFALLYLVNADGTQARLAGSAGLAMGTVASPTLIDLASGPDLVFPFTDVMRSGQAKQLDDLAIRAPTLSCGPYPEPPRHALVLPITLPGLSQPFGLLVAGVSARRALDSSYRLFYDMLADGVTNAIVNARAYEEERARAEALAELDRAKTAFFSNVSHEFRTPLTLLLGPLEDVLAETDALAPIQHERLSMAYRNSLRLLKLVNTLLDFARIEAGRVQAVYELTDLPSLTIDLASQFRAAIERAGLRLRVDCPPLPTNVDVYVDHDMWEKIVLNLLSNAFKFTLAGEIAVQLHLEDGGAAVRLEVRDTGSGIPAEELPRLFERFHRVQGTRARTHEGTGIGLALVQELVKLHRGSVSVESAEGLGSTFSVRLPIGNAHLPLADAGAPLMLASTALGAGPFVEEALRWLPNGLQAPSEQASESGAWQPLSVEYEAPMATAARNGARPRVLLADDNADMCAYVTRLLASRFEVRAVSDGTAALASVRQDAPDLVLADVMMPGMDGFALLRAVRADPDVREIPVVLLSARAGEEAKVEGLQAGADDYLIKPFSSRELLARVEAHVELARLRREQRVLEHQALHDAEAEQARMREMFERAPAIIAVLTGPEHVFELANQRFRELIGARDVLGKPTRAVFPEAGVQAFIDLLDRVYASGETLVVEEMQAQFIRDGELREVYLNFVYQPIHERGAVSGIFVHAVDVTAQVEARAKLEEARALAELAVQNRNEFLMLTTHDLRTPLTTIKGTSQLLLRRLRRGDTVSNDDLLRGLATVDAVATRMGDQIDELLDIALLRLGQPLELQRQPTDLVGLAHEAAAEQAQGTDLQRIRVEADEPRLVGHWDALRLRRVLNNLLGNALKYSSTDQIVALHVYADQDDIRRWAVIDVIDHGVGIPQAELPDIFVQFQRASNIGRISGSGIGLASVRLIVEQHDGTVEVRSNEGQGSIFTVRLPLDAAR